MNKKILLLVGTLVVVWVISFLLWIIFSPREPISEILAGITTSPVSLYCSLSGGEQSVHSESDYSTFLQVPGDSCEFHSKGIVDTGFDLTSTLMNQEPTICKCGINRCWNGFYCVKTPES